MFVGVGFFILGIMFTFFLGIAWAIWKIFWFCIKVLVYGVAAILGLGLNKYEHNKKINRQRQQQRSGVVVGPGQPNYWYPIQWVPRRRLRMPWIIRDIRQNGWVIKRG